MSTNSTDHAQEERYTDYCNSVKSNFGFHVGYDVLIIVVLICWDTYFIIRYQKFLNTSKHVNHIAANQNDDIKRQNLKDKTSTKRHDHQPQTSKTKKANPREFRSNVILCLLILLFYTSACFFMLINHIFCVVDASMTPILGITSLLLIQNSLTVALSLFSIRLKQAFKDTIYEPSDTLFRTLIASVVIFVITGLIGMILFLLDNVYKAPFGKKITQTVVRVSVVVWMCLYVIVIISTVLLFGSSLRKVSL